MKVSGRGAAALNPKSVSTSKKAVAPEEREAERALVRAAAEGDEAAFRKLVERYQRRVYSISFGILQNSDAAMETTQEAFIKVHRYLGSFQGASSFYTWLYRITVNLAIDALRKRNKHSTVDYDDVIDRQDEASLQADVVPSRLGTNPRDELRRQRISDKLQQALSELSDKHRAVIVMRELEGLSYREMAKAMKCSKGTIMSRLHHARKKMQVILREELADDLGIE